MLKVQIAYELSERYGQWDHWVCVFASEFVIYARAMGIQTEVKIHNRYKGIKTWCILEFENGRFWSIDPDDRVKFNNVQMLKHFVGDDDCVGILKCQYRYTPKYGDKVRPWTYFPYQPRIFEYNVRDLNWNADNTARKAHYRGSRRNRNKMIDGTKPICNNSHKRLNIREYFEEMCSHRVCLSFKGAADINHRDVEAMAIGVPVLRAEYLNRTYDPLIPNEHYISVDEEDPGAFIERFYEIADDIEFLQFISENAQLWYRRNVAFPASLHMTGEIIGLW